MDEKTTIRCRPLHMVAPGVWKSHDGQWTFLRHESDPHPKRWFAYEGDDDEPANVGMGNVTLRDVVAFIESGKFCV